VDRPLVPTLATVLAMRGRKPIPTALKIIRGNPGKRRLNEAEPQHPPLAVECPEVLTDAMGRREWDRIAPQLIGQGQVTTVDRAALIGYCQKYGQWQALEAEAAKHPFVVKSASGSPIPNPAFKLANQTFAVMLKAAVELGITPSARSRIVTQPPAPTVSKWAGALG